MHDLERQIKDRILKSLDFFPAVALLGPRQCGKTTLAHAIARQWPGRPVYLDLENVTDQAKLDHAVDFLRPFESELVIIDEVQNRPGLFPEIRGLIDAGRRKGLKSGRFLFLGSASYELLRQSGESLAGRISYIELTPFRFGEIPATDQDKLWVRGGFPDSFLAPDDGLSAEWRRSFIETYLARDLGLLDKVGPVPAVRDLLSMVAHLHGRVLNVSQLAESHEFGRKAINDYLDLFEQTFVTRRLQPWFENVGKRLTKRPKIYLRDSGLLHQLLHIRDFAELSGHPARGASWEGFVIEQIVSCLPDWTPHFYRTSNGAEFDLVMAREPAKLAFEIKASAAPSLTKGFHTARADLKPDRTFVVSRTDATWTTAEGITHTHLADLPTLLDAFR